MYFSSFFLLNQLAASMVDALPHISRLWQLLLELVVMLANGIQSVDSHFRRQHMKLKMEHLLSKSNWPVRWRPHRLHPIRQRWCHCRSQNCVDTNHLWMCLSFESWFLRHFVAMCWDPFDTMQRLQCTTQQLSILKWDTKNKNRTIKSPKIILFLSLHWLVSTFCCRRILFSLYGCTLNTNSDTIDWQCFYTKN